MSAPAQNASPSPASTTARASPTSENAAVKSAISCASKALRRSGRASVTRRTSPSRSTRSPPMRVQLRVGGMLRGALAAALTPLRDAGEALDEAAIGPYVDFLADGGVDGLLALGTTGEGFLLPVEQRRRAARLFVEAAAGRLQVAVHCGAQSTWDTVELAAHAADIGADGIAVMAPPYFPLDAAGPRREGAPVLPPRRGRAARTPVGGRARRGADPVLRVRVRGAQRLSRSG